MTSRNSDDFDVRCCECGSRLMKENFALTIRYRDEQNDRMNKSRVVKHLQTIKCYACARGREEKTPLVLVDE